MAEAARRSGAGFSSTCSGAGTTTTLVDVVATDEGVDADFAAGGWLLRPAAPTAADYLRRINLGGFDTVTGTWTITRAWADAPDSAEAYYVFAMLPPLTRPGVPESWQRLANRALSATWYEDEITIGGGDGSMTRFVIADDTGWVPNEQHIKGVSFRTTDADGTVRDIDQNKQGREAVWRSGVAGPYIELLRVPGTVEDVVLTVVRTYGTLAALTDETTCPLDLVALRTKYELYCYLDGVSQSTGQYKGEKEAAYRDWMAEYRQHQPRGAVVIR